MTNAQDSAKVEAAIARIQKRLQTVTFDESAWLKVEGASLRTLLAHVAAQAEALAQRPTDAGEREGVAKIRATIADAEVELVLNDAFDAGTKLVIQAGEDLDAILAWPDAEPVAWRVDWPINGITATHFFDDEAAARTYATHIDLSDAAHPLPIGHQGKVTPLYAAPTTPAPSAEPCFECGSTERIGTACKPCNPELDPAPSALIKAGEVSEAKQDCWDQLCEVDDRNSPEEYPDMCLITQDELFAFMDAAVEAALTKGEGDVG